VHILDIYNIDGEEENVINFSENTMCIVYITFWYKLYNNQLPFTKEDMFGINYGLL